MYFFFQVKKAFYALVYNGVRAAHLWDTDKQDFVGEFYFQFKSFHRVYY